MEDPNIPYDRVLNRIKSQTPEQQQETTIFNEFLSHICVNISDACVPPLPVISVNGAVIASEGNFSASVGRPKSGKNYNACVMTAAMLSGKKILAYETNMPKGKTSVLYVDTNHSRGDCQVILRRIFAMTGLTSEEVDSRLQYIMLREFSPKERRDIIGMTLATDPSIGFVVIDGIRDLIYDINSSSESGNIINDLMKWTQVYGIHIHTVLQLNRTDDAPRGHLGTELNNKAETILKVAKKPDNPTVCEVRPMNTRNNEFESFAFRVDELGLPELVAVSGKATSGEVSKSDDITIEQHRLALDAVFADVVMLRYGELIKRLQDEYAAIGYKRSRSTFVALIKALLSAGVVVKLDKRYSYCAEKIPQLKR